MIFRYLKRVLNGGQPARLCLIAALLAWPVAAVSQDLPVDVELVMAVDVSGSMDDEEHVLQRNGYVSALRHPSLWSAIENGAYRRVALTYMEWAGPSGQEIIMPWRLIDSRESLMAFADELERRPISFIRGTSISGALAFAAGLFDGNGYEGFRRVIDVSGDGPNNRGQPVVPVRDAVLAEGIVINGLPLMLRPSQAGFVGLDTYYKDCVIGGPGAFVFPVQHRDEMAEAIRRKLVLEIAFPGTVDIVPPAVRPAADGETDCMIGERLRRQWYDN